MLLILHYSQDNLNNYILKQVLDQQIVFGGSNRKRPSRENTKWDHFLNPLLPRTQLPEPKEISAALPPYAANRIYNCFRKTEVAWDTELNPAERKHLSDSSKRSSCLLRFDQEFLRRINGREKHTFVSIVLTKFLLLFRPIDKSHRLAYWSNNCQRLTSL